MSLLVKQWLKMCGVIGILSVLVFAASGAIPFSSFFSSPTLLVWLLLGVIATAVLALSMAIWMPIVKNLFYRSNPFDSKS